MTHYKEILRLHNLGINNTRIAESCGCARSTVISTVQRAQEKGITWEDIRSLGEAEVARKLYPATSMGRQYKMPDYEYIHREMQKSGVTLSLCPLFQTTSPGVDGIVEILPLTLHISNIPLAERSGQLFEAYLFSVVPLAVQKKALIRPTQSATIRPSAMCFL